MAETKTFQHWLNKETFRAFVFDTQREHLRGDKITNLNITVLQDTMFNSLPPVFSGKHKKPFFG